jgi:hypothetical protein
MTQPSCQAKGCIWSTGKSLTPDSDFCSVSHVTQDPEQFLNCPKNDNAAACAAPCEWYTPSTPMHCVSPSKYTSTTYTATTDNCLNVKTESGCANLAGTCLWKPVNDATSPVTPVTPPAGTGSCVSHSSDAADVPVCAALTE